MVFYYRRIYKYQNLIIGVIRQKNLLESLTKKGIKKEIVDAFTEVKREDFVQVEEAGYAYEDIPLPIGYDQTISQPSTIAFMLNLLELKEGQKIMEIGSGSGYVIALISNIIKNGKVYGVEMIKELAIRSKNLLESSKIVEIINRDGKQGLPEFAPFDRILVSASASDVPRHLYAQLNNGGIMVTAVRQSIFVIKKENVQISEKEFPGFAFVPLVD